MCWLLQASERVTHCFFSKWDVRKKVTCCANRPVLSLLQQDYIMCKIREPHLLQKFSPVWGLMFHDSLDIGPIHSHVFFKTEFYTFHFISSLFFFFPFHVHVLKQLNLQAMLLAQTQNDSSEVKSRSGLTHRKLNWKTLCDSEKGFKGPKRI